MTLAEGRNIVKVRAFAKINLTLDVFSKRADGYHGVASVMQSISIHDEITLGQSRAPGFQLTCDGPESAGVPLDDTNLVVRAVKAALEAAGKSESGIAIHLTKNSPSQAGLGGGSSDAAASLVGIDALLNLQLPKATLHKLAASLGSDVPFFLLGGTVVARGRGEQLTVSPHEAPPLWLVVVKPEDNVSTGWAYGELDANPERSSNRGTKRMEEALASGEDRFDLVVSRMCNDFELPVFSHFPRLAWLTDELRMAGAQTARLCGSGSAIFGVATTEADAHRIAKLLQGRYPKTFVARTLTAVEADARI